MRVAVVVSSRYGKTVITRRISLTVKHGARRGAITRSRKNESLILTTVRTPRKEIGDVMVNGKIFGADGKVVSNNQLDPMRMGIEDLIELNDKSKGRGTGLRETDIWTIVIFELSRTKQFALAMANRVDELEQRLKEFTNGHGESAANENKLNTDNRAGATATPD